MFNDGLNLAQKLDEIWKFKAPIPSARVPHLYPSSASVKIFDQTKNREVVIGGCNRKQFLQFYNEPISDPGWDVESVGSACIGDMVQDYIENKFKLAGCFVQNELPVYIPRFNASGRVDTILSYQDPISNKPVYCGVEVKSKDGYYNQGKFINPLRSQDPDTFRPSDEHIIQSMIYYDAFNTLPYLQKFPIEKWIIMYVMRGTGEYGHFEMKMTSDASKKGYGYPILYSKIKPQGFIYGKFSIGDIHARWEELNYCIENRILPDRDFENTYSPTTLQVMNNNNELSQVNSKAVAAGQYAKCTMSVRGDKQPLGDFACKYCPFQSKCWGLNNRVEEQFDVLSKPTMTVLPKWGVKWDPLTSKYANRPPVTPNP